VNEESKEPYNPDDFWNMEVNSKNKMKSLKKQILEHIGLSKKADLILMRELRDNELD
jgi:hypothetical protein